ncbi:MAG: esterase/lipase family protein [Acidimicrobiia bacterium]
MRRAGLVVVVVVAAVLAPVSSGAEPVRPVVLLPGWHGGAASFDTMISVLEAAGLPVLDFDPGRPGTQAMSYAPSDDGQHIPYVAGHIVEERITAALARAGYPPDTPVDVVGYSMGGLVARFLIEHPGADVDDFSAARGWFGDGVPDVAGDWAGRIDDLVMLGTPSHGTWLGFVPGTIGGFGRWNATGGDMRPGSPFLARMGGSEPTGERYVTIGGAPPYLPFPAHDFNGDGVAHGYDGLVPAESAFLSGSEQYLVPTHHGGLVSDPQAVDLVVKALGRHATPPGVGEPNLVGAATVRLEHAAVAEDHDWGTDDEFRFDVSVDPDGGNDSYQPAGRIGFRRDAPFTQDWGDRGPTAGPVRLPGTSPRIDVRLDVWEHDPWRSEVVTTAVFTDLMLSDDLDGMDYYEAVVPLSGGRSHVFRISLNGVSSQA